MPKREVATVPPAAAGGTVPPLSGAKAWLDDELRRHIISLSREPFADVTAQLLGCGPTAASIRSFAQKSPDRWAQAVAIFARLAGYSEKSETTNFNLTADLGKLSDMELMTRLESLRTRNGSSLIFDQGSSLIEEAKQDGARQER